MRSPGLEFATYLMDKQHACRNKCIFCFIDQLPPGMRESLYFKDDDSRLSFLFGNYITLTNLTEHEISRIIEMHISPINISVHTTNPELRCRMMDNRFAGECLDILRRFVEAGLSVQCQLVLVPGYNDGAELDRSLRGSGGARRGRAQRGGGAGWPDQIPRRPGAAAPFHAGGVPPGDPADHRGGRPYEGKNRAAAFFTHRMSGTSARGCRSPRAIFMRDTRSWRTAWG